MKNEISTKNLKNVAMAYALLAISFMMFHEMVRFGVNGWTY